MRDPVYLIGAGGHAKAILAVLDELQIPVAGLTDDDPVRHGSTVLGRPVIGFTEELAGKDVRAIVGIGDNHRRMELVQQYPELRWVTAIHPAGWKHDTFVVGPGSVIMPGAIIRPDVRIGAHSIVNTGATVGHDCTAEDFVHIGPGVNLAGHVYLEKGSFMGIGSIANPVTRIGAWSTVGAGSVVTKDVPRGRVVKGRPARV